MTYFKDLTKEEKIEFIDMVFNDIIKKYKIDTKIFPNAKREKLIDVLLLVDDTYEGEIHLEQLKKIATDIYLKFS